MRKELRYGQGDRINEVQGELFQLFYSPLVDTNSLIGGENGGGGRLLKREIRAASSRNKVTMQIQASASRGVKSRRVGGGSNFHETFPRMNESRRVRRLRVLGKNLPIINTFIFVALLLFRDSPLSSPLILLPPTSSVDSCVSLAPLSIAVLLSRMYLHFCL